MLEYGTKFDQREPAAVLDLAAVRDLLRSHLPPWEIESVSMLSGGFMNSNYRLRLRDSRSLVLRISARSADAQKELSVLKRVRDAVRVPTVVADDFSGRFPFTLIEFIEGTLFSDALRVLATDDLISLAAEAGSILHAIHSFDLEKAGFFDENFGFNAAFENFGGAFYEYICANLAAGRVRERLGETLAQQTLEYVGSKREVYWSITNSTRLIHGDYNLKNILVRRVDSVCRIAGILDWEFAMAGSPLVDVGNFLRFEDELPPEFSEAFIRGYALNSADLPANWREIARLLDLAAMVNFLESKEETPKTFQTAVSVIAKLVSGS
jgi:aminoglycoside phosphotransferase (APT) family kinase protein